MSAAEQLAQTPEPAPPELEALVAAVEALEPTAPSEPAPREPGSPRPRCCWPMWDAAGERWVRCRARPRVAFGFQTSGRLARELYCLVHGVAALRGEGIIPSKVWRLDA